MTRLHRTTWNDRETLICPVRFLGSGVLDSDDGDGPTLYPESVVRESAPHWGLTPIMLDHPPRVNGRSKALTPEQLLRGLGYVFNVQFRDGALEGELYIDVTRMQQQASDLLHRLERGEPCEVSHGTRSRLKRVSGVHNGRVYNVRATFLWPHHLSLSTSHRGICPVLQGFGANFRKEPVMPFVRLNQTQRRTESEPLPLPVMNYEEEREEEPTTNESGRSQERDLLLPPKW